MDLSRYIEIEEACRSLTIDIEGLEQKIKNALTEISEREKAMNDEIESISSNKEQYVRRSISEKIYSSTHSDKAQLEQFIADFDALKGKPYIPNKKQIAKPFTSDYALCKEVLSGIAKDKKDNKSLFEIVRQNNVEDYSKYAASLIRKELQGYKPGLKREKEFAEYSKISNTLVKHIFNMAAMFRHLSGWARLAFLVGYYIVVIMLMVLIQPFIVLWYIKLSVQFIASDSKYRDEQIHSIQSVEKYQRLAMQLKEMLGKRVNELTAKDMQQHLSEKGDITKELKAKIKQLEKKIQLTESSVREEMLKYSRTDNYEKEQSVEIENRYKCRLETLANTLESTKMLKDELQSDLDEKLIERDAGKEELEKMYFLLDKCGESKILPKQFLLGFNEYVPVTMDMSNYCINLLTNKNNGVANVDFVIMCLAQIMCTTNPSCVKITIVDTDSGTTNFGIFNNIPEVITVIKTAEELNTKLEELFELKAERDRDVKQMADDITSYNELMLKNYGLTMPYEIVIVTHHIDSLIKNTRYHQLQSAGSLGIVTITMWDTNILRFNPRNNKEYYMQLVPFLENLENVMYFGGTGDLTSLSAEYVADKTMEIKKMLRSMK